MEGLHAKGVCAQWRRCKPQLFGIWSKRVSPKCLIEDAVTRWERLGLSNEDVQGKEKEKVLRKGGAQMNDCQVGANRRDHRKGF